MGGVQLLGLYNVEDTGDIDVDTGFSIAGDVTYDVMPGIEVGAGVEFQFDRKRSDTDVGYFSYMPVYLVLRTPFDLGLAKVYMVGKFGYNLAFGDYDWTGSATLQGGFFFGVGAGLIIANLLIVEALYSVNCNTFTWLGYDFDSVYKHIDVFAGLRFSL